MVQFVVRLHLSPSDDSRRVVLDLIALPVKGSAMRRLPSYELVKDGSGYPSVLPSWPLLLMGWEETVFPDQKYIVHAIRKMWHNATMPPIVLADDWWRMNKEAKVSPSSVPCTAPWPMLEIQTHDQIEGTQGE